MAVKTDIEIAQEAKMLDIRKVAAKAGITNEDDLELYGKYKAKISDEAAKALEKNERRQVDSCYGNQPDTGRRRKDNNQYRTDRSPLSYG